MRFLCWVLKKILWNINKWKNLTKNFIWQFSWHYDFIIETRVEVFFFNLKLYFSLKIISCYIAIKTLLHLINIIFTIARGINWKFFPIKYLWKKKFIQYFCWYNYGLNLPWKFFTKPEMISKASSKHKIEDGLQNLNNLHFFTLKFQNTSTVQNNTDPIQNNHIWYWANAAIVKKLNLLYQF